MNNRGKKLTTEILVSLGFKKEIVKDRDDDEIKWWFKDGISIHEDSWWIQDGKSCYAEGEKEPEIEFSFATYIKSDGSFKGGYGIKTDQQLKNLYYSLTGRQL